jgi:hypothetical protein
MNTSDVSSDLDFYLQGNIRSCSCCISFVKVTVPLCLSPTPQMRIEAMGENLHAFLPCRLDGDEWSTYASVALLLGEVPSVTNGYEAWRAREPIKGRWSRKNYRFREPNPGRPVRRQSVLGYPAHHVFIIPGPSAVSS